MRTITSNINFSRFLFGVFVLSLIALVESRSAAAEDLSLEVYGPVNGVVTTGETYHYEYNIRNPGPNVSEDVTLRDFLPDEVEFISALVDAEGSLGIVPNGCGIFGNNILWCPLGDIEPTGTVPIFVFVTVRLKDDVRDGADIVNDANINLHDTPDANPDNNQDSVSLQAIAPRQR